MVCLGDARPVRMRLLYQMPACLLHPPLLTLMCYCCIVLVSCRWIVIDLGALHEVVAVSLDLWGTPANPQTVELSTALAPSLWEGWVLVDTIDVPSPTSVHHKQKLLQPVQARYWKVHCRSNWGATWGMGMQRIRFVAGDGALAGNLASRTAGGSDATVLARLAHYAHSTFVHRGDVSADLKSAVYSRMSM